MQCAARRLCGPGARHVRLRAPAASCGARRGIGSGRPVAKGRVSPPLGVPGTIPAPPYARNGGVDPGSGQHYAQFDLGGPELAKMRAACRHAREALEFAGSLVRPGVTTDYIDRKVHEFVTKRGVYPSPYGYRGFPKSLCSSINEVMCHGIPDDRELLEGDIVNLDLSCYAQGHHGDTSATFCVGQVSREARQLVDVTKAALDKCIAVCGPGVPLAAVGRVVDRICHEHGYESSRTYCGHGIGATFHMLPYVLHFEDAAQPAFIMQPGLVFTIEPILCEGSQEHDLWADNWTVAAKDLGLSAQFEHTLVITEHGAEILT